MEENNLTAHIKTISGQKKSEEKRRPLTLIRSCCQFSTGNTNAAILTCFQLIMNDLKLPRHQNRITKTDVREKQAFLAAALNVLWHLTVAKMHPITLLQVNLMYFVLHSEEL